MKEVDDALLTALAENCRHLTHVSIKGCGLVSILSAVKNVQGKDGNFLFFLCYKTFYCKINVSIAHASAYRLQSGNNLCKMYETFLYG